MSTSELRATPSSATLERIQQVVRELLGDDVVLTADTTPAQVEGWDSLAAVSIMFSLEEEFQITLGDEGLAGVETVGELALRIEGAGQGRDG